MSGCNSRQPHQFPLSRAPACAAESPKLSLPGAAPGRLANFHFGVVADKQCTCPASKLMRERYPPTPPFHCGENEIQASLISSASVGATPTPATNLGRCSGCRSVKPVSQTTVGSDDWSITSTSHQPSPATQWWAKAAHHCSSDGGADFACHGFGLAGLFGSVAQLAEQPVVCGKAEGASPFGSAIFSERSSVFRAPGLGPGGRR